MPIYDSESKLNVWKLLISPSQRVRRSEN